MNERFLARVNGVRIDVDDLLVVHDLLDARPGLVADAPGFLRSLPDSFRRQPDRVQGVLMRLQALAALFQDGEGLRGWSGPVGADGVVHVSVEMLAAAVECELLLRDGAPSFDRDRFLALLLMRAEHGGRA